MQTPPRHYQDIVCGNRFEHYNQYRNNTSLSCPVATQQHERMRADAGKALPRHRVRQSLRAVLKILVCVQTPPRHYQDIVCDSPFEHYNQYNMHNPRFGQGLFDNLEFCSSHIAPQLVRFRTLCQFAFSTLFVLGEGLF